MTQCEDLPEQLVKGRSVLELAYVHSSSSREVALSERDP